MSSIGKDRRLKRVLPRVGARILFTPIDDSLLAGPVNGLDSLAVKVPQICSAKPNAVIGFKGVLKQFAQCLSHVPFILNITASTTRGQHTRKQLISSVNEALSFGCDGVAVHVNISSQYEAEMLHILGMVSQECDACGVPLLAIMYFRGETEDGRDENYEIMKKKTPKDYAAGVAHAVRVGVELGADLIKTQFTGDRDSFAKVVESACGVPLVIAGGKARPEDEALSIAAEALSAGASGISFGRNTFSREYPLPFLERLKELLSRFSTNPP